MRSFAEERSLQWLFLAEPGRSGQHSMLPS
jgi:hypothetical protein